jgi:hypothetical protein
MAEVRSKEVEIPLVEVQTATVVAAAEAHRPKTLAAQAFEALLQEAVVASRQSVVLAVAVFNREGFESVHLRAVSISIGGKATQQDAAELRVRRCLIEAGAEPGEHGRGDGHTDTYPINLPKERWDRR